MGTALALKYVDPEESDMAPTEKTDLGIQVAKLQSDVEHVKSDITDIKADIRDMKTRFEKKFDDLATSIGSVKDSVATAKIWALGMYITLAGGLLYVIARSNKWI